MINPETQRFMAGRMGATIRSYNVDHTPMYTAPELVVDVILEAARDIAAARLSTTSEEPMKNNSVAIVTGASQGIGRAYGRGRNQRHLVSRGASVDRSAI